MPSFNYRSSKVTVIGGGIIGMSIAWELANGGKSVRIIDAAKVGQGSSWAAAGILPAAAPVALDSYDPIERLRSFSHQIYPEWTERIGHDSEIDPEFRKCGGLFIARTRGERATMLAQEMHWEDHGIEFERLSTRELSLVYPDLQSLANQLQSSDAATDCWVTRNEYTVRCPRLVRALRQACLKNGVEIIEDCPVTSFITDDDASRQGSPITVECDNQQWASDYVCVTSGAWTQLLLSRLGVQTGILPVRGQMLLYKLPSPPFSMIINDGHRYFVPRQDGHVLVGSCEEEVGFDASTNEERILELRHWVDSLMPDWNERYFVKAWAGLRPGSFDGLPYIGKLPTHPNVILAAGHYRHGIHLAPATAQIVAALVEGKQPPVDISAFHVTRGAILSDKRRQLHTTGIA